MGVADRWTGWAWLSLCVALALHVVDEALGDFLSFYNPLVESVRAHVPFFPVPTFEFQTWITGLVLAVLGLLSLTPLAFRGANWMRLLCYAFSMIMMFNGLGHMAASAMLGRLVPGTISSPLLVASAAFLFASLRWPTIQPPSETKQ